MCIRDRVEVGGLDEDVRRRRRNLAGGPAHDAGQSQRDLTAIGDEQVFRRALPLDVIEGGEPLPHPRAADGDRPRQGVQVEGMQGLPDEEHDVVGDVDRQRDRPHPGLGEPGPHPRR